MPYVVHTVRQTDEGSVMVSDSVEEAGFESAVGSEILAVMADRAVKMFPLLGRLNVVRCWAALRVMPKDGYPIYDQSETCPGAFVATCHSGVTLAAAHALLLPPLSTQAICRANPRSLSARSASMFRRLTEAGGRSCRHLHRWRADAGARRRQRRRRDARRRAHRLPHQRGLGRSRAALFA